MGILNATHLLGVSLRGRITTAHFQETNDVPALFVADSCVRDPNARERAGRLYREYKYWCEDNGHRPLSSTRVAEDWRRLGFEQKRSNGLRYYAGVRMRLPRE